MIKKVAILIFVFVVFYFIGLTIHEAILKKLAIFLPFSLSKIYFFNVGFSILICVNLQLLSSVDKISEQLGFIYLGSLLLKIILFSVSFYSLVIGGEKLTQAASFSILVPTFIFLLTEVFFVANILNKKQ